MHCGQMLAQPAPAPQGYPVQTGAVAAPAFRASNSSKKTVWIIVGAAALLLAALGGLMAAGTLRFGGQQARGDALAASGAQGPNSLSVIGEGGPNSLQAGGAQPPPNLQATGTKRYMPDDIRAWLEHLERIEKRKCDLATEQISAMLVQLTYIQGLGSTKGYIDGLLSEASGGDSTEVDPRTETTKSFKDLNPDWEALVRDFNAMKPPAPCQPLANEFDQHIREVRGSIGDITSIIEGVVSGSNSDPSSAIAELKRLNESHKKTLDKAGLRSDRLLGEICDAYETRKWFSINPNPGTGGLLGSKGF